MVFNSACACLCANEMCPESLAPSEKRGTFILYSTQSSKQEKMMINVKMSKKKLHIMASQVQNLKKKKIEESTWKCKKVCE